MEPLLSFFSVVWMGIVCAVSPCPLATNIAAVSFLTRETDRPSRVLWGGLFYALGRTVTCVGLAAAILYGLASAPTLSQMLQKYMGLALGPLLIVIGAVLLDLVSLHLRRRSALMASCAREPVASSSRWDSGRRCRF